MRASAYWLAKAAVPLCAALVVTGGVSWSSQPYTSVHPDPALEPWRWTVYPELHGFGLWCLAESRDGNMWFGGGPGWREGEVRMFDGVHWTSYTVKEGLAPGRVNALCATRDGSVYAATNWGIARYWEGTWHQVLPARGSSPVFIGCWDILEGSAGDLWMGTRWGLLRLQGGKATLFATSEAAGSLRELLPNVVIAEVPDSALPLRTSKSGTGLWWAIPSDGHVLVTWSFPGSPAERAGLKPGDRIVSLGGDPASELSGPAGTTIKLAVVRKGSADLTEIELTIGEEREWTYRDFAADNLLEDREGTLWIGLSRGRGIVRWVDSEGRHDDPAAWRLYTREDGLDPGSSGPRFLQTRDGVLWATWRVGGGISRFDGQEWETLALPEAIAGGKASIIQTRDGTVWVGHGGSLHGYRDEQWTAYQRPDLPVPSSTIEGLLEASDGSVWLAGGGQPAVRVDIGTSRYQTFENLHFQCETPDRAKWFVSADSSVVRRDNGPQPAGHQGTWRRYDAEDGLMEHPVYLFATRQGVVWAVGHHAGRAAVARFQGHRWALQVHPKLAWLLSHRTTQGLESFDGGLWLMAGGALRESATTIGNIPGLLRYDGHEWVLYPGPGASTPRAYGTAQTPDGTIWAGHWNGLYYLEGETWRQVREPTEVSDGVVMSLHVARDSSLWVGTDAHGVFRCLDKAWTRHGVADGLASNRAESILQTDDGTIWVATDEGVSRFDGTNWTTHALPRALTTTFPGNTTLRQSGNGVLWINTWVPDGERHGSFRARTIRYLPEADPPETEITLSVPEVSRPGNTTLTWQGTDPWHSTPTEDIQFSHRLDDDEWTPYSTNSFTSLTSLASGDHTFQVKARDRDFNEDPTPAVAHFTVVPPVWQQPWFIGLMVVLVGGIAYQTVRLIQRDRQLREGNVALSEANKGLFAANVELNRDRALERVRAEVTAMASPDDLPRVVVEMLKEMSDAGVDFDLCVINIVDEEAGLRRQYGATKEGWSGQTEMPLSQASEAFLEATKGTQATVREVDDALAGRHSDTRRELGVTGEESRPAAILEAPFAYGTLSLSTHRSEGFREEDVTLAEEFARVMAMGYARFLDLQKLEEQNRAMSDANNSLLEANLALQRERTVERVRDLVQAMDRASDFEGVLSLLSTDLKEVGLAFDTCGIDVLDDPVESPTMDHFEQRGFQYTTYAIDPEGNVAPESYSIAAPFPPVYREMIERFIAGEPWQGTSGQTAILEVPVSGYGRLRLTTSEQQEFSEDDIEALKDFAAAIALGYARYLDIREIQDQTERKSAFLANMSHELRSPMNVIIGFTRRVLRGEGDKLSERNVGNLEKVIDAGNRQLDQIDQLMDLSKVSAGRMDVEVTSFSLETLLGSCCAESEPLVKPGVNLASEVEEGVGEVETDEGRVRQIVTNLLTNALKYTEQGKVEVRARKAGDYVEIAVSDTGVGIPPEALDSIFDEYQQVKGSDPQRKGTGLGLAICKGFAELLGGSVRVDSLVGRGSTFTVKLPAQYNEA